MNAVTNYSIYTKKNKTKLCEILFKMQDIKMKDPMTSS